MSINLDNLTQYFTDKGSVILLESQSGDHSSSQKSYLAALPKAEIKAWDREISVVHDGEEVQTSGNPWKVLQQFKNEHNDWLFGYLGYDLKNHLEKLDSRNTDQIQAPDLYFMVPGFLMEIDQKTGEWEALVGDIPDDFEVFEPVSPNNFRLDHLRHQTSKERYLKIVKEAQNHITEGDFYEINLSHQLAGDFEGAAFGLYQKMKQLGPVPFGAFLNMDSLAVCCQSPERFLRKEGSTVFSQPIKGTSQRGSDFVNDEKLKEQLLSSAKERAENLMIVDLVRNDLSRISQRGSVEVPELFSIQSFETVHQMVSTVSAQTEVKDSIEILKACFPMGSMTGAPKISAMKMIEEMEGYRRGIYSGAIGYISPKDDFDFNVVIRTAIIRNNKLFYSVGGAITSDSDPLAEWEETKVKARALTDSILDQPELSSPVR